MLAQLHAPCPKQTGLARSTRQATRCRKVAVVRAKPDVEEAVKPRVPDAAPSKGPTPNPEPPRDPKKPEGENKEERTHPSFVTVALDQVLDTVGDVWRHAGRMLMPLPSEGALDRLTGGAGGALRLKKTKPRVLVLGSGWGAHSLIKVVDTDLYDVVLVSPRNHFLFTPMLPSTAVGTVEPRSLLEPIRTSNQFVCYFEATCDKLDVQRKVATCTSAFEDLDGRHPVFEVPYDILVVAVGEQPATFGVKGVKEYCFFMKEVTDTVALRNRIGECFELASLPGTTPEERQRLLSFVVVGGGPTGVEFAGTLSDYLRVDLRRKYPQLMKFVKVTLLQSGSAILTQFHGTLAQRAMENLASTGVEVRTQSGVAEVTRTELVLKNGEKLPYGVCVWSTGNSTNPLVSELVNAIPEQPELNGKRNPAARKLAVDQFLRVVGAQDVLALGDCAMILDGPLPATAQVAAQEGAYLAHMINRGFVIGKGGNDQPPPARPVLRGPLGVPLPSVYMDLNAAKIVAASSSYSYSSMDTIDQPLSDTNGANGALTHTNGSKSSNKVELEYYKRPFEFLSLGIMAYVGNDKALTQIEPGNDNATISFRLYGRLAFLLWRSVYITKQVSFRNRVLILFDWLKARVFGRDTSLF